MRRNGKRNRKEIHRKNLPLEVEEIERTFFSFRSVSKRRRRKSPIEEGKKGKTEWSIKFELKKIQFSKLHAKVERKSQF